MDPQITPSEVASEAHHGTPLDTPGVIQPGQTPKDNHWVSILAMAIFVIFSLGVVAFLYYQNQQLKNMLANYQTPIVSPTPTATTDPMANWKTYTDGKTNFNFKYPPEWTYKLGETNTTTGLVTFDTKLASGNKNTNYIFGVTLETESNLSQWSKSPTQTTTLESQTINGITYEKYVVADMYYSLDYILKQNGKIFRFLVYPYDANQYPAGLKNNVDQILSTFKFLANPTAAPTISYICPPSGWADCMPAPDAPAKCSKEEMNWYQANCPDFKGGAY
jgi:hypothetical protein